ncbi:MAG TPA: hypothetical protein VFT31_15270 [Kribbella sp.]|nr:hypothetical protein [Kribbella sp.]
MKVRPNLAAAAGAVFACIVIAIVAGFAVDGRLDRHWMLRGFSLVLAVLCAGILVADQGRTVRRAIGLFGVLLWGLVVPVSTTTWSTPPEVDFALAVADDATTAAVKGARSVVTVEDVKAATRARGGAVGTLKTERTPQVQGADAFPLIVRPHPDQGRPRICLSFANGLDARIRSC